MKKIHLIIGAWVITTCSAFIAESFGFVFLGFLAVLFGAGAMIMTAVHVIEIWDKIK